jgi:sporulation protein YlmC with PRC-barrel domain
LSQSEWSGVQRLQRTDKAVKTDDFKKLAVVSVSDGAKLGYIDDLLFDTGQLQVAAFCLSTEGQHAVIPIAAVQSVGADAVLVADGKVVRSLSAETALAALPGLDRMKSLKVVDERGDLVGRLTDLDVDPANGKVLDVRTHEGGVLGIGGKSATIAAADVRSVGDEVMVVAAAARSA